MDRHLKERLVGAAVLVAAAIILIPEMLSGPHDGAPAQADRPADASGVKTYTIDLAAPKPQIVAPPATQTFLETAPAPPPEPSPDSPPTASSEKSVDPIPVASAQESAPTIATPATQDKVADNKAEKAIVLPAPAKAVPVKTETQAGSRDSGAWAVQVASYSARATAERIAAELKAKGHSALVTAVEVNGKTLYRVRVGAAADRAAAEALLKKIQPLHPDAKVVAR